MTWPYPSRTARSWSAPKSREHGDYATNVALRLAKPAGRPPREVAELIAARLREHPGVAARRRRRPRLPQRHAGQGRAGRAGPHDRSRPAAAYGRGEVQRRPPPQPGVRLGQPDRPAAPRRTPGGPRSATRWPGCCGAGGAEVTREYYFNDAGSQIDRFAASLLAAATGRADPGERLRRRLHRRDRHARWSPPTPACWTSRRTKPSEVFRAEGVELMFAEIKRSLAEFGVEFDVYFSEKDLHDERRDRRGGDPAARAGPRVRGRRRGLAAHHRVRRRQGPGAGPVRRRADLLRRRLRLLPGQAASAAATGRDLLLGADHHGYVGRMRAIAAVLRRRPGRRPRDPHRPAGQPARDGGRCG